MALSDELKTLNNAFSGLGVDENAGMMTVVTLLKHEFMRFIKNAVVLWAMHPWERDARLVKEAMKKGPEVYGVIVEIACTRSSEELLGARKAYHSLFDHSIEEDAAYHIDGPESKLLVALVSAYRYEGAKDTISTRSKPHLQEVYKHYREISGHNIDEDLDADLRLKETVQCLCTPQTYFSKVLEVALRNDVDKNTKKGLTRVIVTRADIDMKQIKEEYQNQYGDSLSNKIEETANGNYKDFLLTLVARA
ncbi:hypothetical protein M0R45_036729 [Rubus argutus]|uniref:Uncharacterized protein n=1 Tax=Rubus argutus TaxID=59490 RepID=A0AAW1W071_RUBAR